MKYIIIITILFSHTFLWAQQDSLPKSYKGLTDLAWENYKTKDYLTAAKIYEKSILMIGPQRDYNGARYNGACSWALAGKKEPAFVLLEALVKKNHYTDIDHLTKDADFKSLYEDPRWELIKKEVLNNRLVKEETEQLYRINRELHIPEKYYKRMHIQIDPALVNMIPFRVDERFGFVSKEEGNPWLIQPIFQQVFAVYAEGAIVQDTTNAYGLINNKGIYIIPSEYENIYKEGNLYHAINTLYSTKTLEGLQIPLDHERGSGGIVSYQNDYYDKQGKLLFSEESLDHQTFRKGENYAWFRFGNRIKIRDRKGTLIKTIPNNKENPSLLCISNNLFFYADKKEDHMDLFGLNIEGETIIRLPNYKGYYISELLKLNDNLYAISSNEMSYSFVDAEGNYLYDGFYTGKDFGDATSYLDQEQFRIINMREDSMAIINRKGVFKMYWVRGRITPLINGLRYMGINKVLQGSMFLDQKGDTLLIEGHAISFRERKLYRQYYKIGNMGFYEDWAVSEGVQIRSDTTEDGDVQNYFDYAYLYYFDKKGQEVLRLPKEITFAGHFSENLAPAINEKNELGFINKKGEWAIAPKYELAFIGDYPMFSIAFPEFKGGYVYLKGYKGYVDKNGKPFFSGKRLEDSYQTSH
jgi:hypothetical protein